MSTVRLAGRLTFRRLARDWWRWLLGGILLGSVLTLGAVALAAFTRDQPELTAIVHTKPGVASSSVEVTRGTARQIVVTVPGSTSTFTPYALGVNPNSVDAGAGVSVAIPDRAQVGYGRAAMITVRAGRREINLAITDLAGEGKLDLLPVQSGRVAQSGSEIAISAQARDALGVAVGDQVEVTAGSLAGRRLIVVGLVDDRVKTDAGTPRSWARVAPAALEGAVVDGRLIVVDLPGRTFGNGGSGAAEIVDDPLRITDASSWRKPTSWGITGLLMLLSGVIVLLPLLLPILAVSTLLAVGLEARSREQSLLEHLGAQRTVAASPAIGEGLMIGVVATIVALASAALLGRDVSPANVSVPVILGGLIAGLVVAIGAHRRARQLVRAGSGSVVWRPMRLIVIGGLTVVGTAGLAFVDGGRAGAALIVTVLGVVFVSSLATGLMSLQTRIAPTAAARAALASAWRARWLSTPAAVLIGLSAAVFIGIVAATSPQASDQDSGRLMQILPGPLVDDAGRHSAPRSAVDEALHGLPVAAVTALPIALARSCERPPDAWNVTTTVGDHAMLAIADLATLRRVSGAAVPDGTEVMTTGYANLSDVLTCRANFDLAQFPEPADAKRFQVGQAVAPRLVIVTPGSTIARRLRVTDEVTWLVRTSRELTSTEQRTVSRRLRSLGLRRAPADASTEDATSLVRRIGFAGFVVMCALALIVAAAERRENRELLRSAGVRPRDEALAEAVASGGLAAAGVGSVVITVAVIALTAGIASGSDLSKLWQFVSDQRWSLLSVLLLPIAAALIAFVVFATRRTPEFSWSNRGDDRIRTGE